MENNSYQNFGQKYVLKGYKENIYPFIYEVQYSVLCIYIKCDINFKYLGGKGGQVEAVGILGRQGFLERFNLCLQILYKTNTNRQTKISSVRPMFGL